MGQLLRKFFREEEGIAAVEYALLAGIVVAVAAGIFGAIGDNVNSIFQDLNTEVSDAAP
jgi:pilus assembly protein Flp/PilA